MAETFKVVVFGAAGKMGRRIVKAAVNNNHEVTAFGRDEGKLLDALGKETVDKIKVVIGDATDADAVRKVMQGKHVAVNAALPMENLALVHTIVKNILDSADGLLNPKRVWIFGGLAALVLPKIEKMGVDYGAPPVYQMHKTNFEMVQQYPHLDWTFACPGPMIDSPTPGKLIENLRISTNYVPFVLTPEDEKIPAKDGIQILKNHMHEVTLPYEDVANVIITHLAGNGPLRHTRLGLALPVGQALEKKGWSISEPKRV